MKKYLILLLALLLPFTTVMGKKKEKQNIQVWGEVLTGVDGNGYLTMYKNCAVTSAGQFLYIVR